MLPQGLTILRLHGALGGMCSWLSSSQLCPCGSEGRGFTSAKQLRRVQQILLSRYLRAKLEQRIGEKACPGKAPQDPAQFHHPPPQKSTDTCLIQAKLITYSFGNLNFSGPEIDLKSLTQSLLHSRKKKPLKSHYSSMKGTLRPSYYLFP